MELYVDVCLFFILSRRWDRPTADVAAAVDARLQNSEKQVEEQLRKRKIEISQQKDQEMQRQLLIERSQDVVSVLVKAWAIDNGAPLRLPALLKSVHTIVSIVPSDLFADIQLDDRALPSDVKKAYMKVVVR